MGRYKFNKKLDIGRRLANQKLAAPLVDPWTGEIVAMPGEVITRERAQELARRGVNEAVLDMEGVQVKVFANNMVDMSAYVDFDPEECGVTERVRISVLKELMDQYSGDELKAAVRKSLDELMPKHIIVDDILASVNYLNGLANGVGNNDDSTTWATAGYAAWVNCSRTNSASAFPVWSGLIRERMTLQAQDMDVITPQALINIRRWWPPSRNFSALRPFPSHGSDQSSGGADP